MFIDRQTEMVTLENEYSRDEASFVVVYGRRRVGKTTLLTEFIRDKKAVYYLATEESESQNLLAFKEVVAQTFNDNFLLNANISRWEDVFARLIEVAGTTGAGEPAITTAVADAKESQDLAGTPTATKPQSPKTVIIIDEFQYLCKANKAFASILQRTWDTTLSQQNVMLGLCGSLINMMVEQALSYSSPLYGRWTAQIHMKQIPFCYYSQFFPKATNRQLVERYSVTGGVPKYIELFKSSRSVYSEIEQNILSTDSFLYDEPNFLLQKEVSEIGSYFSIIKAIAAGNERPAKIASLLEVKQTSLTRYLSVLIDLDIVGREVPVTETNPGKSKKGLYRIKDNYLRFWFRYVYLYKSFLESGHASYVLQNIQQNFVSGHVAYVYEGICRDAVWDLAAKGTFPFAPEKVGRFWQTRGASDEEIDVVALSTSQNAIAFGECKYWKSLVGCNVLRELEEKTKKVEWGKPERKEYYVLFSISGFTKELKELADTRDDILLVEGV